VKKILKAEQDQDVVRNITELVRFEEERGEIHLLRQARAEFTAWIERMFTLCGGLFSGPADLQTMKRTIEHALRWRGAERTSMEQDGEDRPSRGKADLSGGRYALVD
jgi:hypothetical protein